MIRLSLIKRRETLCSSGLFEDMSENKQEKEVAPPPPPGFEDVKAGAHLDEVAQVAEKLAKGEDLRLGTKKEGTVDAPDLSLKTGQLKSWADEEVRLDSRALRCDLFLVCSSCVLAIDASVMS